MSRGLGVRVNLQWVRREVDHSSSVERRRRSKDAAKKC
jgi:hypothetical protein